jgi:hypothetical protein
MPISNHDLDGLQVLKEAYDPFLNRIRVDSAATIVAPSAIEVIIDQANDSIRLGDGVTLFTSTTVGPKTGLDVSIINLPYPSTPNTQNISASSNATEYSYTFPANTKKFLIRARGNSILKIAYVLNGTSSNYVTINPGNTFREENIILPSTTIYFKASKNGEIVEIQSWN